MGEVPSVTPRRIFGAEVNVIPVMCMEMSSAIRMYGMVISVTFPHDECPFKTNPKSALY